MPRSIKARVRDTMKFWFFPLAILIHGCAVTAEKSRGESMTELPSNPLSKIDVHACLDKGGVIKNVCMFGLPSCVQKYADAGKTCSDSSDCTGECRIEAGLVEVGTQATGFCSIDSDPCGCFQLIVNGIAKHAVCAD